MVPIPSPIYPFRLPRLGSIALIPFLLLTLSGFSGCTSLVGAADVAVSTQTLSSAGVARITVTVSGTGISPSIVRNLVQTQGQWKGTIGGIPVGSERTFLAQAYDAGNTKLYEGQATGVTIASGVTAAVVILLQESTPPPPFINSAPRITGITASASQVVPGQPVALTVTASDADGDPLGYAWTGTGGTFADGAAASTAWMSPGTGTYTLSVSVTDGRGGQAGLSLKIVVAQAKGNANVTVSFNAWPVVLQVTGTPSGQVAPGGVVHLDVTAFDSDNDPLTYAWADDCGGSFTGATGKSPTWTAPTVTASGKCTPIVTVNDGRGGTTTGQLGINLGLPQVPNAAPVIDQIFQSSGTVASGGTVVLTVSAFDPEATPLTFEWSATGGSLGTPVTDSIQSEVLWTAPVLGRSFTITVVVRDADGQQASQRFSVSFLDDGTPKFQLAGGGEYSMLLKPDGTLWGTGWNSSGQLGDGTTTERHRFVQVLSGVASVAAGYYDTLALKTDGTLWAAGRNYVGELGDGTTTEHHVFVPVLSGVASVAAGPLFTMVVKTDGTLWGAGTNFSGQLGDGTRTERHGFVKVLTGVAGVATGAYHTLALKADGTLWATGFNLYGELGDGTTENRTRFVQVLTDVVAVDAGDLHSLVLRADGTLWATGLNAYGQLGDGTTDTRATFVQVLTDVASIAGGFQSTMALKTDGSLWATGFNGSGQLGDGTGTDHHEFVRVLTDVRSVGRGKFYFPPPSPGHTLVIKADGTLWGAGSNVIGQLGNGTDTDRYEFIQVPVP